MWWGLMRGMSGWHASDWWYACQELLTGSFKSGLVASGSVALLVLVVRVSGMVLSTGKALQRCPRTGPVCYLRVPRGCDGLLFSKRLAYS